jgi:hypothetical protein
MDSDFRFETSWTLHVALEARPDCERVLERTWSTVLRQWQPSPARHIKETQSAPGLIIVNFHGRDGKPGAGFSKQYRCLPDTVDPRK